MTKKALILAGIKWNTTVQRHHAIALHLSELGYEVYFVEGIVSSAFSFKKIVAKIKHITMFARSEAPKVEKGEVKIIQTNFVNPQGGLFFAFNKKRLRKLYSAIPEQYDIIVNYLPISTTEQIINNVHYVQLFYDCVRDFSNWGGYPKEIQSIEDRLIQKSDAVLVDSYYLHAKLTAKYSNKRIVQMLPMLKNGQKSILSTGKPPTKIKRISYIGQIGDHVDIAILSRLCKEGYRLHHFGNTTKKIDKRILSHGFISDPKQLARDILKYSDAIIIPYRGNMDGVIPAKLFECLTSNLPILISDFHDSRALESMMYVYTDTEDLLNIVLGYNKSVQAKKNKLAKAYLAEHELSREIAILDSLIGSLVHND